MTFLALALASFLWVTAAVADSDNTSHQYAQDAASILDQHCIQCHGPKQQLSDLRLDSLDAMLQGGKNGPSVIPSKADNSLLFHHVTGKVEPRMPFGSALTTKEIETLKNWINAGANWPTAEEAGNKTWWAFVDPVRHDPPGSSIHPIDAFLQSRLQESGISSAERADPETLIRRAYLDLTGLLPDAKAVDAFLIDSSPQAYAAIVDKLLESPRYGERWGRHWLDVVRYADSSGYEHDYDLPEVWRFRDYVIRSFNDDKPYNRFIKEQLAGDEIPDQSFDSLIATGMLRIGPRVLFREKDNPQYRYNYLDDMIATTGRVFLAMTTDCARCHDHKFDPISQMDYYRMLAVFFPYIRYEFPLVDEETVQEYEVATAAIQAKIDPLKKQISKIQAPYRKEALAKKIAEFPQEIQDAVRVPPEERLPGQKLLAAQVESMSASVSKEMLSKPDLAQVEQLNEQIDALEAQLPEALPTAMGIRDGDYRFAPDGLGDAVQPGKGNREDFSNIEGTWLPTKHYKPPPAHFLPNADYRNKGPEVEPGVLEILSRGNPFEPQPPKDHRISSGRRMALANWIAADDNPLTARVMANRIWMHHFGEGLVYTASNFGRMGTEPTHPKLLDWLSTEFIRQGWSVKSMHRLIMTSDAYQMASSYNSPAAKEKDPENKLLWKYRPRRVESEVIRDIILTASGKLNLESGGPGFFPPIPEEVRGSYPNGKWEMTSPGSANWRRSVFAYAKRGLHYPMFEVFDQPSMNVSCERRTITTVPTQALTLLNNRFILQQAGYFAERVMEHVLDPTARINEAYRIALSRQPTESELQSNLEFLQKQEKFHQGDKLAALTDLCNVILNLNEFVYVN